MSQISDVKEFMLAAGKLSPAPEEERGAFGECSLAASLVDEEFYEWMNEEQGSIQDFKEALDLMYVVAQYLNTVFGYEKAELAWTALHQNNMSKCIKGEIRFREDGKILKPAGYVPLDLTEIYEV